MKTLTPPLLSTPLLLLILLAGARLAQAYYDPGIQRWINRDPIGEEGGFNLYAFVDNNAISRFDRNGNEWGGIKFPLDWFDPKKKRDCEKEDISCRARGAVFCGFVSKVGIGGYCYPWNACIFWYLQACLSQKQWCEKWNRDHGF